MKNIFYTIAAACILSTTSCEHKNLCYDHAHTGIVNVVFDWRNAPNAAPKSMSCYLFPTDGGEVLRYEFTDRNGGAIRVPAGRYDALCLNSDTENISYRHEPRPCCRTSPPWACVRLERPVPQVRKANGWCCLRTCSGAIMRRVSN